MKVIGCILITIVYQILAQHESPPVLTEARARLPECIPGTWVRARNGDYPRGALAVGARNNKIVYLIRSIWKREQIPGELYAGKAHIAKGDRAISVSRYEVFCGGNGHWTWVPYNGKIPRNALIAGENVDFEPLYVCRGLVNEKDLTVGKFEKGNCYVGDHGKECQLDDYDILVEKKNSENR